MKVCIGFLICKNVRSYFNCKYVLRYSSFYTILKLFQIDKMKKNIHCSHTETLDFSIIHPSSLLKTGKLALI